MSKINCRDVGIFLFLKRELNGTTPLTLEENFIRLRESSQENDDY